jgi:hypothetical protein
MSTKMGPSSFIRSIRSYRLTQPSLVLGGKNSNDHQGWPLRSLSRILSLILTTVRVERVSCRAPAVLPRRELLLRRLEALVELATVSQLERGKGTHSMVRCRIRH